MSLNKVMLIGNVGKNPEVRYTNQNDQKSNAKVATFSLATSERYNKDGASSEITEWHSITVWGALADIVEKYVKKGSQLYIEGKIRTRSWTDQTGNKRYTTEIAANTLQLLGRKGENSRGDGGYSDNSGSDSYRTGDMNTGEAYQGSGSGSAYRNAGSYQDAGSNSGGGNYQGTSGVSPSQNFGNAPQRLQNEVQSWATPEKEPDIEDDLPF